MKRRSSKRSSRPRARSSFPTAPSSRRGSSIPSPRTRSSSSTATSPSTASLRFACSRIAASNGCWIISTSSAIATSTASTRRTAIRKSNAASTFGTAGVERRGIAGDLHDDPAPVFTDPTIVAYRLMSRILDQKKSKATAFVGTTCPAAIGAIRACWERDVEVGKDLSICSVNIEPPAEFFCPSITGLNTPDLSDVLEDCFDWFGSRLGWRGSLLLEPKDSILFEGESTGRPK